MANPEQVARLKRSVEEWNQWRKENSEVEIDLSEANLSKANLSKADLSNANLSNAYLKQGKAVNTNFENATLTGACIEDWHINSETNFENVTCDYIYLKYDWLTDKFTERRPSDESKIFNQGDFQRLVETTKETIDLIFSQGIDWNAFLTSFNNLQIEDGQHNLSVKAIEQKDDGTFVVRVNAPANVDKGEIEKRFFNKYQLALKEVTKKYKQYLQAKDREIEIYRQQSADILELAKLQASRPIIVGDQIDGNKIENKNEFKDVSFGGGFAGNDYHGNIKNVTNNYADSSLTETVTAIEGLINELSQTLPINSSSDQMRIATQAIETIETNSTWREKAIQASQQGLLEAIKTNPIGAFIAGVIEGWKM